jgi:hypothetical protein
VRVSVTWLPCQSAQAVHLLYMACHTLLAHRPCMWLCRSKQQNKVHCTMSAVDRDTVLAVSPDGGTQAFEAPSNCLLRGWICQMHYEATAGMQAWYVSHDRSKRGQVAEPRLASSRARCTAMCNSLWAGMKLLAWDTTGQCAPDPSSQCAPTLQVYYEAKMTDEGLCRVGLATRAAGLELGIDRQSFGFGGTGKKSFGKSFEDYGQKFGALLFLGTVQMLTRQAICSMVVSGNQDDL